MFLLKIRHFFFMSALLVTAETAEGAMHTQNNADLEIYLQEWQLLS